MKLVEFQGKNLYSAFNVPTTTNVFLEPSLNEEQVSEMIEKIPGEEVVLKIQILSGKRGKRGGVKIVAKSEAYNAYTELMKLDLGEKVFGVLVEEKVDINKEYYLSLNFDRSAQELMVIFSVEGGVDIESVDHDKIHTCLVSKLNSDFFSDAPESEELLVLTKQLHEMVVKSDAMLVEINPLVVTGAGKLIAADSKVVVDDNSRFRHQDIVNYEKQTGQSEAEILAEKNNVAYVELDGDIGVVGNGAGLTMATLDFTELVIGQKPANFLDIGGGANAEKVLQSLEVVKARQPKVIWLNIFGGITSCKQVALGIIDFKKKYPEYKTPVVARVMGTEQKEAIELLKENNLPVFKTMQESATFIKDVI